MAQVPIEMVEKTNGRRLTLTTALMHINFQVTLPAESDPRPGLPFLPDNAIMEHHRDGCYVHTGGR